MTAEIIVVRMREKVADQEDPEIAVVNTCSNSDRAWSKLLSPFIVGPCPLWGHHVAKRMENAWQYSKCYACHVGKNNNPTEEWLDWATTGWAKDRADRYPMGKGAKPLYSYWDGKHLGYIEARKRIYAPLYANAVYDNDAWKQLRELQDTKAKVYLRDWDGYNHKALGMSLTEVLNNPDRIMGHAFVLAMLLEKDAALDHIVGINL